MIYYGGLWLQNPLTYIASNIIVFFNFVTLLITIIRGLVIYWIVKVIYIEFRYRRFRDHEVLEIWWTCMPVVVLIFIGVPSIRLLYIWDCQPSERIGLKVLGRQWYWRYEYGIVGVGFDSFVVGLDDLDRGQYRILEVDNRVVLPGEAPVRVLISAGDVLHRWAVPGFGVKVDAVPGRLNRVRLNIERPGVYYGQCSELCGVGHRIMPIVVEIVSWDVFLKWLKEFNL